MHRACGLGMTQTCTALPNLQLQHAVHDVLQCLGASNATGLSDVTHLMREREREREWRVTRGRGMEKVRDGGGGGKGGDCGGREGENERVGEEQERVWHMEGKVKGMETRSCIVLPVCFDSLQTIVHGGDGLQHAAGQSDYQHSPAVR